MDDIHQKLGEMLKTCPNVVTSRQRLKAALNDFLSDQPLYVNLLLAAYDEQICKAAGVNDSLDESLVLRYRKRLETRHGLSDEYAQWAVITWFSAFGKMILQTPISKPKVITPKLNLAPEILLPKSILKDVASPLQLSNETPASPVQSNNVHQETYSAPRDNNQRQGMLRDAFRACFRNMKRDSFLIAREYYGNFRLMTEQEKQQGYSHIYPSHYGIEGILQMRMDQIGANGWALTYDNFCVFGKKIGDYLVPYAEIDNVYVLDAVCTIEIISKVNGRIFFDANNGGIEWTLFHHVAGRIGRFLWEAKRIHGH